MPSIDNTPPRLLNFIETYYHNGGTVVGLCTGSFILAQTGLLNGRKAVVHHRHRRDFLARYPDVQVTSRDIFIECERLITCPGGTAAIDLVISLLSRKLGQQRARKGLVEMSIDRSRSGTEMAMTPLSKYEFAHDTRVRMAIQLMRENLSNNLKISAIAESVGVSVSQLGRIFQNITGQSPVRFRRLLRVEHARWLLTNSTQSLTRISMEAGFSDPSHFSRVFLEKYAMSPRKFRLNHLG
jgi:transcriptional regulator GlxA family with amidase domain